MHKKKKIEGEVPVRGVPEALWIQSDVVHLPKVLRGAVVFIFHHGDGAVCTVLVLDVLKSGNQEQCGSENMP